MNKKNITTTTMTTSTPNPPEKKKQYADKQTKNQKVIKV